MDNIERTPCFDDLSKAQLEAKKKYSRPYFGRLSSGLKVVYRSTSTAKIK